MGKRGTPRASCDPCRRKKVRCDKDQRNAEGISLCSFCCARGYDCVITEDVRPNAETSDNDADSSAKTTVASATGENVANISSGAKKRKKSNAQDHDDANGEAPHDSSTAQNPFAMPTGSAEPDMLNVRGLTRSILDNAVSSHFRTTHWCNPAVNARHFYTRYRRYLSKLDGVATSSAELDMFPAPDIVILAVACVGVVQLLHAPNRFELQTRIFRRLEKLVSQACTKDITVALDVLEAILLTFDIPARNKAVEEATTSSIDAGYFHPMSHTKMIRLLKYHGVNRSRDDPIVKAQRQKYRTPERALLCEINDERMPLIFAVASVNDVIRSFDMFDRHQLLHEDIDPDATIVDLGGPVGNQWGFQLSVMASVLRCNNNVICAAKSRRLGIPPSAILEVLEQLERFDRQIPEALRWNTSAMEASSSATLGQLIPYDNTSEDIISILVRKAFLNLLLWSQYRCIHTLVQAHGMQRPTQGSRLDGSVYLRARQRLDSLLLTAIDRMSQIYPQLASIEMPPAFESVNLLDYNSIAFRSSTKGAAYYSLEMAKLCSRAGLPELAADLLSKAGKMIFAFSTYRCHPDTQAEAARMRRILSTLYTESEMIPGLGSTNEVRLRQERERFSSVFEPNATFPASSMAAMATVSDIPDITWNGASASAPVSTSWSTPGTDDLSFGGSVTEFLAGLPFVNAAGTAATSPHPNPSSFIPKTPASAATPASPFDLNAFLDTQIDSSTLPNTRQAPTNF